MSVLQHFLDINDEYMPHGHCYLWYPEILWLHLISDGLIAFSYFSIPFALCYFAIKRRDIPFRPVFCLFAAFIILCGLTHLFGIWTIWNPDYGPQGLLKALTGIVSLITAIAVWYMLPKALKLPSPNDLLLINEKLHETNKRIEQEVAERTSELAAANAQLEAKEQKLRKARDEADRANQAKSDFLAQMSHEIRTPLSSVITIADILPRSGTFNAKQQELINAMRVSSHTLLDLINNILDVSKIEAGEFELCEHPFSCETLIEETLQIIAVRTKEKGIALRSNTNAVAGKWMVGDRMRLRQVLLNLLGNAVKFTHEGEISLLTCINGQNSKEPQLIIDICDTGMGIPAERCEAIFEKFHQSENDTSGNLAGTGLGLAISRFLIGLMGGTITLESTEGKGSVFTIRLPLHEVDPPEENEQMNEESLPTANAPKPHRILLVEDYPGNIIVATTLLEELGYAYDIAHNGKEALDFQEQNIEYAAVLMDVNMPIMDGLEATRQWRKREESKGKPRTYIIGLTAHVLAGDDERCIEAGMDSYLAKPLTLNILRDTLGKLDEIISNRKKGMQ